MFLSLTSPVPAAPSVPAQGLLDAARGHRRAADRAEADLLATALAWADMHPAESIDDAAVLVGWGENAVTIAGPGAPLVAEFCVAELAAALGLRTEAGRDLLGETVELAHRLPKVWARVQVTGAPSLPAWKARRIARATMTLSREAAAYVDAQIAPYAHRVGLPTTERLVAEAVARFMPALAERQAREAADRRCVDVDLRTVSFEGTCRLSGELDLADALDLDTALTAAAQGLVAAGSHQTQRVLRSVALGDLARGIRPLPLAGDEPAPDAASDVEDEPRPPTVTPCRVVLHVHLADAAMRGARGAARVEGTAGQGGRHLVTTEQVRGWCRTAGRITVTPVIDTTTRIGVEAYEIPDRLHAQVAERDIGCTFPWCERPASVCDTDHVVPHARGGPTATDNLAPLCRHHHRLKTHTAWASATVEPGAYLWRSPHGATYIRDHTGTRPT